MPAHADGEVRRARTALLRVAEELLHDPVLERVERDDAEAATGRALVKQYADSIIEVEVVATLKVTVGDHAQPPRENKIQVNGTVLAPGGLTVTVLSR